MRIIILGSNGMLGSMMEYVGSTFYKHTIIPINRNNFDVLKQSPSILNRYFTDSCYVVNCIGAIPQRNYHEKDMILLNTTPIVHM